jgi:hypothetical protein
MRGDGRDQLLTSPAGYRGSCRQRATYVYCDLPNEYQLIGQEYFAEVDEDYILDRFNLTGLNGEVVQEYSRALDLITDSLGELAFIRGYNRTRNSPRR